MDEEFDQVVIECQSCHLKFYATELKVDSQTNVLKCINCHSFPGAKINILRERPLPKKQTPVYEEPQPVSQVLPPKRDPFPDLPLGFTAYQCVHCRYLFKRKSNFNGTCPYCSKGNLKVLKRG
ncbi:hypothetical protein HYX14_02015 [Candidatus Woesearchaeota archaeon]|nr:hypothetical protein [Candidatus Woesearchaeota archaeon]